MLQMGIRNLLPSRRQNYYYVEDGLREITPAARGSQNAGSRNPSLFCPLQNFLPLERLVNSEIALNECVAVASFANFIAATLDPF